MIATDRPSRHDAWGWRSALPALMALALPLVGLSSGPIFAQRSVGANLEVSGFVMKEANTASKMERLGTLPERKFVARTKNGVRYFMYADRADCRCVYIGSQEAMNRYRELARPGPLPPGYVTPTVDNAPPTGVNPEAEIIQDMDQDGFAGDMDDILHPGF